MFYLYYIPRLFLGAGVEFADTEAVDAVNTGLQPSDIFADLLRYDNLCVTNLNTTSVPIYIYIY